jgi:hypothetical protein
MWATYDPSVRKQINTLMALGIKQIRPLLLSAVHKFSQKEFEKLLRAVVCWSVRYLLAGITPGALETHHGRNAMKIATGEIKTVEQLTVAMLAVVPDDERFKAAVATANVSQARLARYYLRAMQMQEDGNKEPQYVPNDGRDVTLEHILPEHPGSEWNHIPSDAAKANYNKLGNQVLLAGTVNSKLGNVGYSEKKRALKRSPFSLTKEAALFSRWTVKSIAERQERLAELAVKTWPLPPK